MPIVVGVRGNPFHILDIYYDSLSTMSQHLFYTQRSGPQDEDLVFNKSLVIWGVRISLRSYSDYRNGLMKAW